MDPVTPPVPPARTQPKWPWILLVVVLLVATGTGGIFLGMHLAKPVVTPTPVAMVSIPTPTPDPTANWKMYIGSDFNLTFRYPGNWFVSEEGSSQFPDLRVQNYDPKTAPGRDYDPIQDKGKYLLEVSRFPAGNNGNFTTEDIIARLPKNGDNKGMYIGDDAGQIIILSQDKLEINGFPALHREISYSKLPNITESYTYLLDKTGNGIVITYGLDVIGGKTTLDQILSTFKFTNPASQIYSSLGQSCGRLAGPAGDATCALGLTCQYKNPQDPNEIGVCVK